MRDHPADPDRSTVHLIIKSALMVALFSLLAGVFLALTGYREGAIALLAAPNACLGGLFALLARTGDSSNTAPTAPVPVEVRQPAHQPVPVQETGPGDSTDSPTDSKIDIDTDTTPKE